MAESRTPAEQIPYVFFSPWADNAVGFALLQGEITPSIEWAVGCEHLGLRETWQRHDDGLTYAHDSADGKLWESNTRSLADFDRRIRSLGSLVSTREDALRYAVRFFERAARAGEPEGMWNLGWRLHLGEGIEQSDAGARHWWQAAAARGHTAAAAKLEELGWSA